jgi:uncharacterized membrane protein
MLEIIKIILPLLLVLLAIYFLLKLFFNREQAIRADELKFAHKKEYIQLRIQAYERVILFLERIDPNNLIMRVHSSGMNSIVLHSNLIKVIRDEYSHNMSQQIYISISGWNALKKSKEETVKVINTAQSKMLKESSGIDLSSAIFEILSKMKKNYTEIASEQLKKEFQRNF